MQRKKQLILLILNELNANSDRDNPLTQTRIARNLSGESFTCDRKTVCRNIRYLQEMGYPIQKTSKGFYLDKEFSLSDIAFIKGAVLAGEGKSENEKELLSEKLVSILSKLYRR